MELDCSGYDIIGDVHGCFDELVELLELLGYRKQSGSYRHATRRAVFLGDLVDRGPKIRETLHLVQAMVEKGDAQMVLGNHEFNVIAFHTPARPRSGRRYIREQTESHRQQLEKTLRQFSGYEAELQQFMRWFYELPLFLEFENFRVAHACWDQALIEAFKAGYSHHCLSEEILHLTTDYSTLEFKLVNRLTRGTSLLLPNDLSIVGSDGIRRRFFRTKFWSKNPETYGDVMFQPDALPEEANNKKLSDEDRAKLLSYDESEKPLFVGHYWRVGEPDLLQKNIACLDYSAVYGGRLVAYRIDRPGHLSPQNLVWVDVGNNYGQSAVS